MVIIFNVLFFSFFNSDSFDLQTLQNRIVNEKKVKNRIPRKAAILRYDRAFAVRGENKKESDHRNAAPL